MRCVIWESNPGLPDVAQMATENFTTKPITLAVFGYRSAVLEAPRMTAHNEKHKDKEMQKETLRGKNHTMRNLGIEPRAPRRRSDGNGEFYH